MFEEGQACAKLRVANLAQTTGSGECSLWAPLAMAATSVKHVLLSGLESYGIGSALVVSDRHGGSLSSKTLGASAPWLHVAACCQTLTPILRRGRITFLTTSYV